MENYPEKERRRTERRSGEDRRRNRLSQIYRFLVWTGLKMEWRRSERRKNDRRKGMSLKPGL